MIPSGFDVRDYQNNLVKELKKYDVKIISMGPFHVELSPLTRL